MHAITPQVSMQTAPDFLQPVFEHPSFQAVKRALAAPENGRVTLAGLTRTAKALVLAGLAHALNRPLAVLSSEREAAEALRQTTSTFFEWLEPSGAEAVYVLPDYDVTPYEGRSPHAEIAERRAIALVNMAQGNARIVLAPGLAAFGRFRDPVYYRSLSLELKPGDELSLEDLVEHLSGVGYDTHEPVDSAGSYSVRGGIIDVYPPDTEWPLRIEFFGDQIESIRAFDPANQRSRRPTASALIRPLSEQRRSGAFFRSLVESLGKRSHAGNGAGPRHSLAWAPEYSAPFPGWEFFASITEPHPLSLFALLKDPVVVWDEPSDVMRQLSTARAAWDSAYAELRDVIPPRPRPEDLLLNEADLSEAIRRLPQLSLKELEVSSDLETGRTYTLPTQQPPKFQGGIKAWIEDLRSRRTRGEQVITVLSTLGKVERFEETLRDYNLPFTVSPDVAAPGEAIDSRLRGNDNGRLRGNDSGGFRGNDGEGPLDYSRLRESGGLDSHLRGNDVSSTHKSDGAPLAMSAGYPEADVPTASAAASLLVLRGVLNEGVIFPEVGVTLLGENDIFGGFSWGAPARKEKSAVSRFISDLSDLKAGDTVVHVDHGIGLYHGLKRIEVNGEARDFMLLTYQDDAKLYVPLERLDLVEKYRSGTGQDGPKPTLDRLGGATWARTKTRVKHALRDMTAELLRLYAERKMSGGVAFSPDTPWQKEFDEAFEFTETEDQLKALEEIKRDLESPEPMDRLLCGDVGYGKTELAMRAAFKVVQDGKQVAVLAPTTVLSFQHFTTFNRRMAGFPVRVELISRFRSAAEQKKIIAAAAAGEVDILIGTHRLLSKDVAFKDLGLLIVDEEQRFGVAAKEKLKRMRASVDVLTMSATPIPRTLHMSLGGLRDLSVIETPPRGRLAIQTTVAPYGSKLVQTAILNEMEREGQVYFVHNRVESIFSIAAKIQQLVPNARIGVGHGQMANNELERVMMKFVEREYDVLVSTSIIENGLDIPRANTIIINRADRFGLSELYQLRGRVGRSDRRAYAYLLIPDEDSLTPIARRRLAALKEFSDLGAGFRLAALDLELRGAGNILGGEQSGHLNAIGLDLYLKMLEETAEELKGLASKPDVRTTMSLGVDIRIPEKYISDEGQRLRMYKRISGVSSPEARTELDAELADRYGSVPASVSLLLDYALLKNRAEAMLIQSVDRKLDDVWIRFHSETPVRPENLTRFVRRRRDAALRPDGALRFRMPPGSDNPIPAITSALQELQASH